MYKLSIDILRYSDQYPSSSRFPVTPVDLVILRYNFIVQDLVIEPRFCDADYIQALLKTSDWSKSNLLIKLREFRSATDSQLLSLGLGGWGVWCSEQLS